jgi:D-alanyl-D-alanine carboxypeptidase
LPFVLPVVCRAGWSQPVAQGDDQTLVKAISETFDFPGMQSGFQGVLVQSLRDGRTLYSLNAEKTFVPASNNKLLTSAIALGSVRQRFHVPNQRGENR